MTTYLVCDLRSGLVLDELPLDSEELTKTVAREESQQFTLDVHDPSTPDDWHATVVPGKAMIVALTDTGDPMLAWVLLKADIGGVQVPLQCVTLEHCLTRVNVPTVEGYGIDEGDLVGQVAAKMIGTHGFLVEATTTGRAVDAYYSHEEDVSVFTALSDRMATEGGPEWRIVLRWADETRQRLDKVIEIGPQIGSVRPDAVFDRDETGAGVVEDYVRGVDYSTDKGTTQAIGTADGAGASRPMSATYVSELATQEFYPWPIWESRPSFSGLDAPDVDDPDAELERRARAEVARKARGTRTWTLHASPDAPRPGYDFDAGDTIPVRIAAQGKRDPEGGSFDARVIGWTLNTHSGAVTPVLWEDTEES